MREKLIIQAFMAGILAACNTIPSRPPISREKLSQFNVGEQGIFSVYSLECRYEEEHQSAYMQTVYWASPGGSLPQCPDTLGGLPLATGSLERIGNSNQFPEGYWDIHVHQIFGSTEGRSNVITEDLVIPVPINEIPDPCEPEREKLPLYQCTVIWEAHHEDHPKPGEE